MNSDPFDPRLGFQRRRKPGAMARLVPLFFFVGGCLLLSLSVAVIGGAFFLRPNDSADLFAWKPPLEMVDNRALALGTGLLSLSTSSTDALNAALDKGQLENALALVAYDYTLPTPSRVGALLQLAERYGAAKDTRKAVWCYQVAAQLATITPEVSDPARLDTDLLASSGLRRLNANDSARWMTDSAFLIAQFSPVLQRDIRARRLAQISDAYTALNADRLAASARTQASETAGTLTESVSTTVRLAFNPSAGKLPVSAAVNAAIQARRASAQQLIDDIKDNPPKNPAALPQDFVAQLSDALDQEDRARLAYYDEQMPLAKGPDAQGALLSDKVAWLALKYRIARGAFGFTLVAAWEKDRGTIAADFSDALSELFRVSEAQAAALPNGADQAIEDVIRRKLFVARWGWFTGIPEQEIRDALDEVTLRLRDAASPALRLDTITRAGKTLYLLVPDDLYGQGEKALPR